MIQNSNSFKLKLVLIGDQNVGKSSLLERVSDDQFRENPLAKIGIDLKIKTFPIDGKQVKLLIWDTIGQERFKDFTCDFYRGIDGIILVYDVSDEISFNNIENWIKTVENHASSEDQLMLIGNKSDLESKQVSTDKAFSYAQSKQMEFFEVSAKTSDSVTQAFLSLARKIKKKKEAMGQIRIAEQTLNSNQQQSQNQMFTSNKLEIMKDKVNC